MINRRFFNETKRTLKLSAPISGMFLANMFMQIVDTFFVGKLGPDAIAGLSIGVAVYSLFMVFGVGLLLGLDFLVSKAYGERNFAECRHLLVQGSLLAVLVSLPLIGFMQLAPFFFKPYGLSEVTSRYATEFLRPISWSLLPFLVTNVFRMYLQGQGNSSAAFYVVILGNLLNFVLNPLFIFGGFGWSGMGISGSATATFIGRWISLFVIMAFAFFHSRQPLKSFAIKKGLTLKTQKQLLALGMPASGQLLLEVGVFVATTFTIGLLSSNDLAAHQIVLHIASFTFMIPLGVSAGGAVLVGQAMGRKHFRRVQTIGNSALFISFIIMSCCGIIFSLFGENVISLFTTDASVIALGKKLLFVAAIFQISDGFQVTAAGILRGIGNTKASLWANFAGHWLLGFPLGYMLCFGPMGLGALGSWIGLSLGLTSVAIILTLAWRKKSRELANSGPLGK